MLQVEAGEFVGIIGRNGSGKTTAMRILAGLTKPDSGRVLLEGRPIESIPPMRRARRLAFVPQSHPPAFEFTVAQTVLLGRIPHRHGIGGFERPDDLVAANRAMALMDLDQLRQRSITKLSGGEQQRAVLARALAQESVVLLLDEPNTHLDFGHQLHVMNRLAGEARRRGVGVIASMHDLNLASILCDRIILLDGGHVLGHGSPTDVLRSDLLAAAFGADLEIEPDAFGGSPAVRYRYDRTSRT